VAGSCEHGEELWGSIKCVQFFLTSYTNIGFSKSTVLQEVNFYVRLNLLPMFLRVK
jgi:hypothetical protein